MPAPQSAHVARRIFASVHLAPKPACVECRSQVPVSEHRRAQAVRRRKPDLLEGLLKRMRGEVLLPRGDTGSVISAGYASRTGLEVRPARLPDVSTTPPCQQ